MQITLDTTAKALFAAASLVLAWHPVQWLIESWSRPAHEVGALYVVAILGLAIWSMASGPPAGAPPRSLPFLLVGAAGLRFLSQTLAIDLLGGFALGLDVYAIGLLLGLDRRPRAVAPLWLAGLFLFALPIGVLFERLLGFPLQMISAWMSCGILSVLYGDVTCAGVRIGVAGQDVLVDLPCAGASGIMLMLALFAGLSAIRRPGLRPAILWGLAVLALAVTGNSLRISLLAVGLVHGWDVMAEPLHSLIGLVTLAASAIPFLMAYRPAPLRPPPPARALSMPRWAKIPSALGFLGLSFWIIAVTPDPVDVSRPVPPQPLPYMLAGEIGQTVPLSDLEHHYFRAYGGTAIKAQYGALGLNRVSTTSPLRHLHRPDICLLGMGYAVRFLGTTHQDAPTSVYEATAPDGTVWLVEVSYYSDQGHVVSSVGEAIWLWMRGQGGAWSSLQRITPLTLDAHTRTDLNAAALAALDIPMISKEPLS